MSYQDNLASQRRADQMPCPVCDSLGFVSHDDKHLSPLFNVVGLTRVAHSDGRITWEGDCRRCGGTGFVAAGLEAEAQKKKKGGRK